jgi:type VI secretion system protein VasG
VSLLDTACARVAVSQHATPPELEDCLRRLEALRVERDIIVREQAIGIEVGSRAQRVASSIDSEEGRLVTLQERHAKEKAVVDRILEIRATLRAAIPEPVAAVADPKGQQDEPKDAPKDAPKKEPMPEAERTALLAELRTLQGELTTLQGDSPLILPTVDEQAIASVVQDWTGVPVGRMVKNEVEAVLKLADTLNQRVIGQKHALDMIAKRIQTSRAKLDNPNKPIGVFMLCGTSGVGKTETALALAEALYGGEQNVITINMSEFQEAHTVSTLKGSPPGYVGYGEGGVLTEAVRRRPYSVVLLDEVEKAHPDVHELFFQVFDKGWMEDGEGRGIDFKNTIILLTSNVGSELIMNMCRDPELMPEPEGIAKALREPLLKVFPAALLGRIVTIPYYPLSDEMMGSIVRLQLGRIAKRVRSNHGIPFEYGDDVVKLVVSRCTEAESGGRVIDAILTNTVLPRVSLEYLNRLAVGETMKVIRLGVKDGDFDYGFD